MVPLLLPRRGGLSARGRCAGHPGRAVAVCFPGTGGCLLAAVAPATLGGRSRFASQARGVVCSRPLRRPPWAGGRGLLPRHGGLSARGRCAGHPGRAVAVCFPGTGGCLLAAVAPATLGGRSRFASQTRSCLLAAVTPVGLGGWLRCCFPGTELPACGRCAGHPGWVVAVLLSRHGAARSRPSRRSLWAGGRAYVRVGAHGGGVVVVYVPYRGDGRPRGGFSVRSPPKARPAGTPHERGTRFTGSCGGSR
ncbi:hypothetical protein BJ964_000256 [Actinoplanes lobatus]|uniref:Uncharacterized protein n=1 Tax=Actinoplanes lobatus TaxID=113568 RepID=A0A7W7H8N4_9ACTN|nr:hypothetical protein [Actinoplanes lobatus]